MRHRCDVRRRERPRGGRHRHRQSGKRRRGPGDPEHEPDARSPGNGGPAMKILVKLGGTLLDAPESRNRLAREIAALRDGGHHVVVVHGGGKQMTRFLTDKGVDSTFVNGLRVTTLEVLDAVLKVVT